METRGLVRIIPHLVTAVRIVLVPHILLFVEKGQPLTALALFSVACITDLADGMVARSLGATSRFGELFDVWADFFLFFAIVLFVSTPWWASRAVSVLMSLSFSYFLLTSRNDRVVYDPLGKRTGLVLSAYAASLIVVPQSLFASSAAIVVELWLLISISYRAISVKNRKATEGVQQWSK